MFEKVIASGESLNHMALKNLAVLLKKQGKYEEADPLFLKAMAIFELALPPFH